jgi:hypothetical protein
VSSKKRPKCADCQKKMARNGLCPKCRESRRLVSLILDDTGRSDHTPHVGEAGYTEDEDAARRLEIHRARCRGLASLKTRGNYRS